MGFTINIATSGSAFDPVYPEFEVNRILAKVARQLNDGYKSGVCMDINGNRVGEWSLEGNDD